MSGTCGHDPGGFSGGGGGVPHRTPSLPTRQQAPLYPSDQQEAGHTKEIYEGVNDEISMISTDKVYLLSHTENRLVHSLQIYDADDISEEMYGELQGSSGIDYSCQVGNRERLDLVEEVMFGFGITFRLAGLCERVKLCYHESFLVGGRHFSGYQEVMGEFGRLDHVEKAYYYCPREVRLQAGARILQRVELEISIRTDLGVELFSRRWQLRILPKSQLNTVNLGEATVQVDVTTPSSISRSSSYGGGTSTAPKHRSSDSLSIDSFVDVLDYSASPSPTPAVKSDVIAMPRSAESPNVFQQVGIWLYGSKLGQYMVKNFDPTSNQRRPKQSFLPEPLWLLGVKYELKPTNLLGFTPISLSPAKSCFKLNFGRKPYEARSGFYRKAIFKCHYRDSAILMNSVLAWSRTTDAQIKHQDHFMLRLAFGQQSELDFRIFTFEGGLVLEVTLRSDIKLFPSLPVSFLADSIKHLSIKNGLIECFPFISEWNGTLFDPPESEVSNLISKWAINQPPFTDHSFDDCFLWDAFSREWILGTVALSQTGHVVISTKFGSLIALQANLSQLAFKMDGEHLVLITGRGVEYYIYLPNIQLRSSLSAKFYLMTTGRSQGVPRPRSPAIDFRKGFQLQRIQQSMERRTELQRRHTINTGLVQDFLTDFEARFWFTYRRDMPRIANTLLNTDAGWGCMIRCGQMMVAESYSRLLLGRGWNHLHLEAGGIMPGYYMSVAGMFEDKFANNVPYSFHSFVMKGAAMGHPIGQWFSPTLLARVCFELSQRITPRHLVALPVDNGILNLPMIRNYLLQSHSVLLMCPLRLGMETFNPLYLDLVTGALQLSQSVGIIGGKPGKCFHIVGHQTKKELLYLDPHVIKEPVRNMQEAMHRREFHTNQVLTMDPKSLDPSLLFGFLLRNIQDLDNFIQSIIKLNMTAPVFSVQQ